jgi:hypothetical protein
MPTKAQGVPVSEMQACARSCTAWLVAHGFTTGPVEPEVLLFSLTDAVNESAQGGLVMSIFYWLWCSALPPVDGRRANEKSRAAANPELPPEVASLYFGETEHELARKIRGIVRSIELLERDIAQVKKRQRSRVVFIGQDGRTSTEHAFYTWLSTGRVLQTLVEPTGLGGISAMQVPHTLEDWRKCRLNMERALYSAKFSNSQIAKLLPDGGSAKDVFQRRRHAQKVDLGVPAIEHRPKANGKAPSVTADGDESRPAQARRDRGARAGRGAQREATHRERVPRVVAVSKGVQEAARRPPAG